jgi:carbamoyltransferase
MGLAPYGKYSDKINYFEARGTTKQFILKESWIRRLEKITPRTRENIMSPRYTNLAAQAQYEIERVVTKAAKYLFAKTESPNLCLAGGVALNSVMNKIILDKTKFKNIFILPGAGDSGVQLGGAIYAYYHFSGRKEKLPYYMDRAYLGVNYSDRHIRRILKKYARHLVFRKEKNIEKFCAQLLAQNKFIGWFQGKSEFGPRALGNRSILANPKGAKTKDYLNERIKHRESFRPFAPSILEEKCSEYFNLKTPSPFMLFVADVKKNKKREIPAVIHVDNTARVQTVNINQNPRYYKVIQNFYKITGTPVVLNTSFNLNGEPIVETPEDAVLCFLKSKIDALLISNFLVTKPHQTL